MGTSIYIYVYIYTTYQVHLAFLVHTFIHWDSTIYEGPCPKKKLILVVLEVIDQL